LIFQVAAGLVLLALIPLAIIRRREMKQNLPTIVKD
jgi:hypothetical protein